MNTKFQLVGEQSSGVLLYSMVIVDKIIYISKKLAYISKNLEERA
jgi:hypothetical protein